MFPQKQLTTQYIPTLIATVLTVVVVYVWFSSPTRSDKKVSKNDDCESPSASESASTSPLIENENEAQIIASNCFLLVLSDHDVAEVKQLSKTFCGTVITDSLNHLPNLTKKTAYLCGDLCKLRDIRNRLDIADNVYIIEELSSNITAGAEAWQTVSLGRVPILVHGVGVLYRRFFEEESDFFNRIRSQHAFQSLTESTKPGTALRTGIYLCPVNKVQEDVHFNLLRCSSNFSGPTGNFQSNDYKIIDALNQESSQIFNNAAPLNHVLAQIYRNKAAVGTHKQTKAKIKEHSDKTKDMPTNGIMAFVTFYEGLEKLKQMPDDHFDYGHKTTSGLTKLVFRLKKVVSERPEGANLVKKFSVTLSPNSVFFMPLSTNRLYTHEIVPSTLGAEMLPTRMGYVVRCSNVEALSREGVTFLKEPTGLTPLEPPTASGMSDLRKKYADENLTAHVVDYGRVHFSMNKGDYTEPFVDMHNEFRTCSLNGLDSNLFEELLASAPFEAAGKGREGAVLVKVDDVRGVPIVRTTTKYQNPAHQFRDIHSKLAAQIEDIANLPCPLNNALIENYNNDYATMGYHTDQAQDLADGSCIALFSTYEYPQLLEELPKPPRKLVVESKAEPGKIFEIPLDQNSVVLFSTECNRKFKHKIVLDNSCYQPDNRWLGITFRTSKTFIQYPTKECAEQVPRFSDSDTILTLATDSERREFFSLRSRENKEIDFTYPELTCTISPSDLLPPT